MRSFEPLDKAIVPVPLQEPGRPANGPSAGPWARLGEARSESKAANTTCRRPRREWPVDLGNSNCMLYPSIAAWLEARESSREETVAQHDAIL
jgi:hypothetical protein